MQDKNNDDTVFYTHVKAEEAVRRLRQSGPETALHKSPGRFVPLFAVLALAGFLALPLWAAERPVDSDITYWVREALRDDPVVDAGAISPTTRDGVVTLTGTVRDLGSRIAAVEEAKKIQGVVGVLDKLTTDPVWRPDTDVAEDVRHRIVNSAIVEAHGIRVTSQAGKVTLEGRVPSWVEAREAELLASETRGVREVENALQVDYTSSRTDQEIKNDTVAALGLDVYLRELPITVGVTAGTVTLTGTVGSLYERDRASDAVLRVPHVKRVDNRLKVDWLTNDRARRTPPLLSDGELQANVSAQLERDGRIDASKIVVKAIAGHVILSGSVPFGSHKRTATQDARDTVGVAWVTDKVLVVAPPREDSAIRADEQFEMAVDGPLRGLTIDVAVQDGVVTLSGTVHTWYQRNHAQTIAWRPRGVKRVVNHLEVARDSKYADAQLAKKIESRLKWNWTTYWVHDDIDVDVNDGIAYLRGHVNTWSERAEAGRLASRVAGIWQVRNKLRVGDYPYPWDEWNDEFDVYPYGP